MKSKNQISKFWLRALLLSLPALGLLTAYAVIDPFKVVQRYDDFNGPPEPARVRLNRDYVSTQTFIQKHKEQGYDSFILGSSRSQAFKCASWSKYLQPQARPFHFDAYGESLLGLYSKVVFMRDLGVPIKNALILLDGELLRNIVNPSSHIFIIHPATSGDSWIRFHLAFLRSYYTTSFFREHWVYLATGEHRPHMRKLPKNNFNRIDLVTNDNHMSADLRIAKDADAYYKAAYRQFENRGSPEQREEWAEANIGAPQREMLDEIKAILEQAGTKYQIVINPAYHQVPMHPDDLQYLARTFGADRVHDYSGVNEFTEDYRNYYDASHFRPVVADEILRRIYTHTATVGTAR